MIYGRFVTMLATSIALITLVIVRDASAQDRRIEAQAREALRKAQLDYELHAYDSAIARIKKAGRLCTPVRCSNVTRSALARDLGVMHFRAGDEAAAMRAFKEALKLDPKTELDPNDVTPDLTEAFEAARDPAEAQIPPPPSGDFEHTPAAGQAVRTPLPIYVEYTAGPLARVIVKYKRPGDGDFKKLTLERRGKGWAGLIPCADVVRGVVRYFIQGFDDAGTPIALSGSPKQMFAVPISETVQSAPSLPGMAPPVQCDESGECVPGTPGCGGSIADEPPQVESAPTMPKSFARVWIGVSGAIDVAFLPSANDVCKVAPSGAPANSAFYYCTSPGGVDFPSRAISTENDSLAAGNAGKVGGGAAVGDIRVMLTADYALNANAILGARIGYVAHAYTGQAAINDGRTFAPPLHFEVRGAYVFGDAPLANAGFAPMVLAAAIVSKFDAATTVAVTRTGVSGILPMNAWKVTGPLGVAVGAGLRYGLSQRIGFELVAKAVEAFGAGGALTILEPEASLKYGF